MGILLKLAFFSVWIGVTGILAYCLYYAFLFNPILAVLMACIAAPIDLVFLLFIFFGID